MTTPAPEVTTTDVSSYLASKGWERDGDWRGANVWRLGTRSRLLIPASRQYDDDDELLGEAVRQIAACEERPVRDVILDINQPNVDAQYFRAYPETPSGTISLPSGLKAVQGIHDLLKTAATTVDKGPELVFEGRRSSLVDTFLNRVSLAAAVPGSYVLATRVPTDPLTAPRLDGTGDFSGRSVMTLMLQAVQAAHAAVNTVLSGDRSPLSRTTTAEESLGAFYERVSDGVSANLCKALADLGGQHRDRPFDMGFSWARGIPGPEDAQSVSFTADMPGILWRAAEELESLAKSGQARITGLVEELRQRPGEEPRAKISGQLQIQRGTTLSRRMLWVVLSPAQNEQAIQAYRERWTLEISGRLTTDQRRLEMLVDEFRVLR